MQQVPNSGECATSSDSTNPNHATTVARWSRIPRVQLLRNKSDQRVPFYIDQTVPVWPLRQPVHRSRSSNASPEGTPAGRQEHRHPGRSYGVAKAARKFAGINKHTVWFRSIRGADAHAWNVTEILRECSCHTTTTDSSKWSGIEQDLFTCTSVDPKHFVVPSAADFISNKKCKSKGKSQSED